MEALIAQVAPATRVLSVDEIEEDPKNARRSFDAQKLEALAASIRAQGLLVPVVVRPINGAVAYRLVDGARRLRAAKLAGLTDIRCEVRELDDSGAAVAAATANLQREDLTPYEEALAYKAALDAGLGRKEVAELAGVAYNTVKHRVELLDLPELVATRIGSNGFTIQHAQAFLPLASHAELLKRMVTYMRLDDDDLRNADQMGYALSNGLVELKLGKMASYGAVGTLDTKDAVKALKDVPSIVFPSGHGGEYRVYTDVSAFDAILKTLHLKAHEARKTAAAAVKKPSGKQAQEKAEYRHEQLVDAETDKVAWRFEVEAVMKRLAEPKGVAESIWLLVAEELSGNGFEAAPDEVVKHALDGACKLAGFDAVKLPEPPALWKAPKWFLEASAPKQYAFATAAIIGCKVGSAGATEYKAWTGATSQEIRARAEKGVRASLPDPKAKKSAQELLKDAKAAKKAAQSSKDKAKGKKA